jgi:PAS domain S-box-containing protein
LERALLYIRSMTPLFTRNRHLPNILMLAGTLLLIGLSYVSYSRINSLIRAAQLQSHTEMARCKINEVADILDGAQTAQRGYMLTADAAFLRPLDKDLAQAKRSIQELRELTRENTHQQLKIISLEYLVGSRFQLLSDGLAEFQQGNSPEAMKPYLDNGKLVMDKIEALTDEMLSLEDSELSKGLKENERFAFLPAGFSLYVSIILTLASIIAFVFVRTRNKQLRLMKQMMETANDKLKDNNLELQKSALRLQESIQLVANKNLELQNTRVFLETVFDSSVDMIFTLDKNLHFITINSRALQFFNLSSRDEILGKYVFDLFPFFKDSIHQEATLKAFRGEHILLEQHESMIRPGVVLDLHYIPLVFDGEIEAVVTMTRDVTQRVRSAEALAVLNQKLETNNRQLEKANAELGAFTYIASHDLQEPMRKIKTFSRKLLELESENISDKGKHYFDRILSASTRMQNLIDALLDYSRLDNKKELVFAKTKLQDIIDEVRKNLFDIIEEKDAQIQIGKLPALDIVPVQFSQLFTNLIGNSIKYSKKDSPPRIKISSRLLKNFRIDENSVQSNYWKITLKDNGIGFDPDYSEKIFELFRRLHGTSEYSGTGIGLAICKKVVENHHGIITATGQPGAGATFDIYIPVSAS